MNNKKALIPSISLLVLGVALLFFGCQESKANPETAPAKTAEPAPKSAESCSFVLTVSGMS